MTDTPTPDTDKPTPDTPTPTGEQVALFPTDTLAALTEPWRPATQDDLAPSGAKAKAHANLVALTTLRTVQAQGHPATDEQRRAMAHWAGWGALPNIFDENDATWAPERAELRHLLDATTWAAAERTTLNAHYTSAEVVSAIWATVVALGFAGGKVIEPGCGSGNFIGLAPAGLDMSFVGIELDPTTAAMAAALYPDADIRAEGYGKTRFPLGHFDLGIGNVPFGKVSLHDPVFNKRKHTIHNHFIIKTLRLVRPGGLVAVLTSRYTLDAHNPMARHDMAGLADLVGAVRFPLGAFRAAAGTDAIEDLVIFRRTDAPVNAESWTGLDTVGTGETAVAVNTYFAANPDQVLGTLGQRSGRFGPEVTVTAGSEPLAEALDVALNTIVSGAGVTTPVTSSVTSVTPVTPAPRLRIAPTLTGPTPEATAGARSVLAGRSTRPAPRPRRRKGQPSLGDGFLVVPPAPRKEGSIVVDNGDLSQVLFGVATPYEPSPKGDAAELRRLIGLRDTLVALLDLQAASGDDESFAEVQAALNARYDAYVAAHGPLNRFTLARTGRVDPETGEERNRRVMPRMGGFRKDPDFPTVIALEIFDPDAQVAHKAAVFSKRIVGPRVRRDAASSPADALALCLDEHGEVRVDTIAGLLGIDEFSVPDALGDLVWEDPETGELVIAARYLSGNVRHRLHVARLAAHSDDRFAAHVAALEAVLPADLGPTEIDARLGATWIGVGDIKAFAVEVLGDAERYGMTIEHSPKLATWSVTGGYRSSVAMTSEWGTGRADAGRILQSSLNQSQVSVYDEIEGPDGKKKRVLNSEATMAAREKQEAMGERFAEWVWEPDLNPDPTKPSRAERLCTLYNERFNSTVLPVYDGSHLTLPSMALNFHPHPHQLDSVWRILSDMTVGLFQPVGSGKTFIMAAAGVKLKQLGMVRQPWYVVPNHMLEQFTAEFLQHFPRANVLMATRELTTPAMRKTFVARCATGDWDAVIITRSAFERIPMSLAAQQDYIAKKITALRECEEEAAEADMKSSVKGLQLKIVKLEERLARLMAAEHKDNGVTFGDTGCDYVFYDESHGVKNLGFASHVQGMGGNGSQRASDMEMKLDYLRKRNGSRIATLATATPVANTLAEIYVNQVYLQPEALEAAHIANFDAWAAQFGRIVTQLELSPDGSTWRIGERFARFANVPELMAMFRLVADVRTPDELNLPGVPVLADGEAEAVVVADTEELKAFMVELAQRAEDVRAGRCDPTEENMLTVCNDGRKAALHLNLVDRVPDGVTKPEAAADRIAAIYHATRGHRYADAAGNAHDRPGAFQLVFCDLGTPKDGRWSVYADLRDNLVELGVPAGEVAFMHDAANDRAKADLFAACRDGRVAVLVGSTEKMGTGTNMQARLIALHHLDCPWRPCDLEQRDGRGLRQGNQNPVLAIIRYVTKASFDVYLWQCVARKAAFIYQVMSGRFKGREVDDIGDTSLNYAEVKALATGNPLLLEQAGVDQEVAKLVRAERAHRNDQFRLERTLAASAGFIAEHEGTAAALRQAVAARVDTRGDRFSMVVDGVTHQVRSDAGLALLDVLGGSEHLRRATTDGYRVTVAHLGGFDLDVTWRRWGDYNQSGIAIYLAFAGIPGGFSIGAGAELAKTSAAGLISQLEHRLAKLEDRLVSAERNVASFTKEATAATERIGKPFPGADELARLTARQAVIAIELEAIRVAQDKEKRAA